MAACDGAETEVGTGGAGGTGGAPECVKPADCVIAVPDCRSLVGCVDGACAYEDAPEGKPISTQALDDCVQVVCDGAGSTKSVPDPTDVPTDDSPCTEYACDGTMLVKTLLPSVPCYTGPAGTEGAGACKGGMMTCNAMGLPEGDCEGEVLPAPQMCGPDDTDCDGQPGPMCP
jgi:hypothetical protein